MVKDRKRVPTKSCIATFAGVHCPSEIKLWPLVFRVDKLQLKLLQRKNCQRYGHSYSNCKSSTRCGICGGDHSDKKFSAPEAHCCMRETSYNADSDICPGRTREVEVIKLMDAFHWSGAEAWSAVKGNWRAYSSVATLRQQVGHTAFQRFIEDAMDRSVASAVERLVDSLVPTIA